MKLSPNIAIYWKLKDIFPFLGLWKHWCGTQTERFLVQKSTIFNLEVERRKLTVLAKVELDYREWSKLLDFSPIFLLFWQIRVKYRSQTRHYFYFRCFILFQIAVLNQKRCNLATATWENWLSLTGYNKVLQHFCLSNRIRSRIQDTKLLVALTDLLLQVAKS